MVTTTQRQRDSGTQGAALAVEMGSDNLVLSGAGDACVREGRGRDLFTSRWLRRRLEKNGHWRRLKTVEQRMFKKMVTSRWKTVEQKKFEIKG
ncbi:hypothetical protein E2542_SST00450 [Spatholobus suberectus]|nr:hypothetical protein E2542_SST00450 [Spatholobus suberectus]